MGVTAIAEIQSSSWSETAASNTATPPDGAPEGMARSGVNNVMREDHAVLKREWNRSHPTVTNGGSSTVLTLTYTTAPTAYAQGLMFAFKAGQAVGATPTINVNALGAKKIYKNVAGTATQVAANDWYTGQIIVLSYDTALDAAAGGFNWVNHAGNLTAASETVSGIVELATDAETITGTDTARAITPANLQALTASDTRDGIVELATPAEVVTGTDTARAVTAAGLHVKKGQPNLLSTATPSGAASVEFLSLMDAALYSHYDLIIDYLLPATDAVTMNLTVSVNNGGAYASSGYHYARVGAFEPDTVGATADDAAAAWILHAAMGNATNEGVSGRITLIPGAAQCRVTSQLVIADASGAIGLYQAGGSVVQASVNAIKIAMSSGNMTGTLYLIGYRK